MVPENDPFAPVPAGGGDVNEFVITRPVAAPEEAPAEPARPAPRQVWGTNPSIRPEAKLAMDLLSMIPADADGRRPCCPPTGQARFNDSCACAVAEEYLRNGNLPR